MTDRYHTHLPVPGVVPKSTHVHAHAGDDSPGHIHDSLQPAFYDDEQALRLPAPPSPKGLGVDAILAGGFSEGFQHVMAAVEAMDPVVLEDVAEEITELYREAWDSPAVNVGARLGNPAEVGTHRAVLAMAVVREVLERRRS